MTKTRQSHCELCKRRALLTFHHLIPRKMHRRQHFRKKYAKQELLAGINICQLCHRGLHKLYDEMTLAKEFSDLDKILNDENIQKHVSWVKKQKRGLFQGLDQRHPERILVSQSARQNS